MTQETRIPTDTLALRLRNLRYEQGLSQREAAAATGVPFAVWQGMEKGVGTRHMDRHIALIAVNTGYDRDWLMWGGPLRTPEAPHPVEGEGPDAVRREGIEPPTRWFGADSEADELADRRDRKDRKAAAALTPAIVPSKAS